MSRTNRTLLCCLLAAGLSLGGCSRVRSLLGIGKSSSSASAAPSAAPSAAGTPSAQSGGVCKVVSRKVWGTAANARTGITVTRLSGGSFAIGVAMGNRPEIIAFDRAGQGRIVQPAVASGTALAKGIPSAQGQRDLQRVTPAVNSGGELVAYADYRDVYKNKRRRIACGRTDSTHELLVFDGKPLLDREDEDTDKTPPMGRTAHAGAISPGGAATPEKKPAPAAKKPAPATRKPARGRLVLPGGLPKLRMAARPQAKAPVARTPPKAAKPAKPSRPERELRDCRSFVDPAGHDAWAVGSELYEKPESDGSTHYSIRFFVDRGAGRGRVLLRSEKLPDNPDKLYTFEAPVAEKLPDGSYVLAARYRGSLFAWTLGLDKRPRGPARVYGGSLGMPHMLRDGDDLLMLLSQATDNDHWAVRLARVPGRGGTLPAKLQPVALDSDPSQAEPTFAIAAGQRWIAYQAGERRHGQLVLVPVDAKLAVAGQVFRATSGNDDVYESHLFGLDTGKLLAVYIESAPSARLVSEVLDCHVES
jgi:hypothetical protein